MCAAFAFAGDAHASEQLAPESVAADAVVQATLDKSVALRASGPVGRVVVSQPELVQVALAGSDQIYIIGKELGEANLLVYDRQGRLSQTLDLRVGYDAEGLRQTLADALPGRQVNVTSLARGLLLEGEVATPAEAKAVQALAERVAPDGIISRVAVQKPVVRVDIRIAEVNARALRELGAAFSLDDGHLGLAVRDAPISAAQPQTVATLDTHLGDYRLTASLRALEGKGEARVVAQPMLVVASGAVGDFRSGGELPVPTPQDKGQVTIEFRPYGAGLKVAPTVQDNGLVRLQLETELSEPDPSNAITLAGVQVPALIVRKVGTVVDLRDGETLMLAGLLQQQQTHRALQPPWLAKLPLVGQVFRSTQARETQRELAIFVTPHVGAEVPPTLEGVHDEVMTPSPPPVAEPPAPQRPASQGPRGPPLRLLAREVKEAVTPPARWLVRMARRAWSALA